MSEFELDPMKDAINKAKHGLPLDLGSELFDGPFVENRTTAMIMERLVSSRPARSPRSLTGYVSSCIRGATLRAGSSASGKQMTKKSPDTAPPSAEPAAVPVSADRLAAARAWMTPERLAALDAMTDADIATQIASNPDAAPELTDEWFENARLVIPLKSGKRAA